MNREVETRASREPYAGWSGGRKLGKTSMGRCKRLVSKKRRQAGKKLYRKGYPKDSG